jgi:hypothetical protein
MKNLSKTMLSVLAVGLLSSGLFCQQAQAVPAGTLNFNGSVTLTKTDSTTFNLAFDSVKTGSATGVFHSIPVGTTPREFVPNLEFNTENLRVTDSSIQDTFIFWTVSDPSFLTTFQYILHGTPPGSDENFRLTSGSATIGPPTWAFSISGKAGELSGSLPNSTHNTAFTLSGTGTGAHFMFTGTFVDVPDGGFAAALLGIALLGLEGLRRKLRAS